MVKSLQKGEKLPFSEIHLHLFVSDDQSDLVAIAHAIARDVEQEMKKLSQGLPVVVDQAPYKLVRDHVSQGKIIDPARRGVDLFFHPHSQRASFDQTAGGDLPKAKEVPPPPHPGPIPVKTPSP